MNSTIVPFRLLIINDSQQEAQRLASMFQNSGKPCRAQHINNLEAFHKTLSEQNWDLVIANNDTVELPPVDAIRAIRKHNSDLPVILLSSDEEKRPVIDGLKLGACDVVQLDDDQHLLLVVSRELENKKQRKNARVAERKTREFKRLNRQLLDRSKDGIAFMQDGMFIYANESFALMCGYENADDLECVPLMDIAATNFQDKIKKTLKEFTLQSHQQDANILDCDINSPKGDLISLRIELQHSQFDDETCIQLLVNAPNVGILNTHSVSKNQKAVGVTETTDIVTGLFTKTQLHNELTRIIKSDSEQEKSHAFLYIDIDQFENKVESIVGIDGANEVLSTISSFIQGHSIANDYLAKISDNAFAIITEEVHLEKLLNTGNVLVEHINQHFFEVKNKTIRLTASIGITIINEKSLDAQSVIKEATHAIEALRKQAGDNVGNGTNLFQPQENNQTVLISTLQKALKDEQFKLLFQPIISLRGDQTELYEVLLRMITESGEQISPSNFMQAAASMNTISKIDRWVTLETIKHLSNRDSDSGKVQLITTLSHHTLGDESFIPWLGVALKAAKINPASLIFQFQETEITQHLTAAKKFIGGCSSMGIEICINQFGCALEPLSLLEHIDVDHIKIDGSFSAELQENPKNKGALESLLQELHKQNKITIVPLVESASIISTLWQMGAHCIQGYYLQPPSAEMNYEFSEDTH
jgi:diguanylate cyclase (GGDEF)-like protein